MKSYLISGCPEQCRDINQFKSVITQHLSTHKIDYILYRDKQNSDYENFAKEFLDICANFNLRAILHGDVDLAYKLYAGGVHLTSRQFEEIERAKSLGMFVIISTHTLDEAERAEKLGADAITFSPIFATPNKGEPKGLAVLKDIVGKINIKIFALGGIITQAHIEAIETTGVYGFASIRYFVKE